MIRIVLSLFFLATHSPIANAEAPRFGIILPIMAKDARLMGFDLTVTSGRVAALRDCPPGWQIVIDNDAAWHATISAHASVGAAALDGSAVQKMLLLAPAPATVADTTIGKFSVVGTVTVMRDGNLARLPLRGLRPGVVDAGP